jgi:hypothetical protein
MLTFYEGVGVLKIEESESEVLTIEESESELLCTDSTAVLISSVYFFWIYGFLIVRYSHI